MKIIVLSKTDYRNNDIIINAINDTEIVSFLIRGARNATSPFKWLNTPLTIADVEFVSPNTYKHPVLKRAKLLISPLSKDLSLNKMLCLSLVCEATIKMLEEQEKFLLFNDLDNFVKTLQVFDSNPFLLSLTYLAKAMKIAGFLPEVNKCVKCGAQNNIVAFSFEEGGMICKKCMNTETKFDLTPIQMKLLRIVFSAPNFAYTLDDSYTDDDMKILLNKFKEFIADTIGVELNNINLLCNN